MQTIKINPVDLSTIFWSKVLDNAFLKQKIVQKDFFTKIDISLALRYPELDASCGHETGAVEQP